MDGAPVEHRIQARSLAQLRLQRVDVVGQLGARRRTQLLERLDAALHDPHNDGVGVLFLDLDGFTAVNDRLGHDAGDEVLQQVAAVLRTDLRPTDLACRLGGDAFVVCCAGVPTEPTLKGPQT